MASNTYLEEERTNVATVSKREGKKLELTTLLLGENEGKPYLQLKKTTLLKEDFAEHEIVPPLNGDIIPHSRHFCAFALCSCSLNCLCMLEVKLDARATHA